MNENDFLINEEEDNLYEDPIPQSLTNESEDEDLFQNSEDNPEDSNSYDDTSYEYELSRSYDSILNCSDLNEVISIVIAANPINTSGVTISEKVKEFMHLQGKTRISNSFSSGLLVSRDIEAEMEGDDSGEINERKEKEARDLIWRFIKYLTERDLSKDNIRNRTRKLRHIPALIIYLFSNKMYGLLINCPYLPKEYQDQISNALSKISEKKYELVNELAEAYDSVGRTELANKVRELKLGFFDREPAELKILVEFRSLSITDSDVAIYKSIRNRYMNISKSITQEVASDLIEVVIDKEAGISEKLKDKVRTDSIIEVKSLLKDFAKDSSYNKDNDVALDILLNN